MPDNSFPKMITSMPEADITFEGVRGWLLQGPNSQVAFMEIQAIGGVAPHSHGEQWGVVIDGEMELTIGDHTRRLTGGDTYHIPAGVVHSARFLKETHVIDVFAEKDRYTTK